MPGLEAQALAADREQLARYREHMPERVALRVDLHERLAAGSIDELHQRAEVVQVTRYHQEMPGEWRGKLVAHLPGGRGGRGTGFLAGRLGVHFHVGWRGAE